MDKQPADELVKRLLAELRHSVAETRLDAVNKLGRLAAGNPLVVDALQAIAARDRDHEVRQRARDLLFAIGQPRKPPKFRGPHLLHYLLGFALWLIINVPVMFMAAVSQFFGTWAGQVTNPLSILINFSPLVINVVLITILAFKPLRRVAFGALLAFGGTLFFGVLIMGQYFMFYCFSFPIFE